MAILPIQMTAVVHHPQLASHGPLSRLVGPHVHSIPGLPLPALDYVNPMPTSLFTPTHRPTSTHPPSGPGSSPPLSDSTSIVRYQRVLNTSTPSLTATTSTEKRSAADAFSDDEDAGQAARALERRNARNAARRRYKNFKTNGQLHNAMHGTMQLLQVKFATQAPFPSPDERKDMATKTFAEVLEELMLPEDFHELSDDDIKLLRSEDTSIRSRVQKATIARIVKAYNLVEVPMTTAQVQDNCDRVRALLNQSAFHYQDPETRVGRFQNPLVFEVIWSAFYLWDGSIACIYPSYFNPIPRELIALVLTSIRHSLKMWETGKKVSGKRFAANQYVVYDQYLKALEQYDTGEMQSYWRHIRCTAHKKGLKFAGVQDEDEPMESVIELAEDDELDRELAHLRSQYGDVPPSAVMTDMQHELNAIPEPRALSNPALSALNASRLYVLPRANDDYNGEFDEHLQEGTPAGQEALPGHEEDSEEDDRIGRPSGNGRAVTQDLHTQRGSASSPEGSVM
ncbi:hypothetical protein LXA43DRAFT_1105370 [Ganoderma leucocontextum]|nr:hypothetical protein LXA43DRAFT_1105370 [Ganoderma leucocontextum]